MLQDGAGEPWPEAGRDPGCRGARERSPGARGGVRPSAVPRCGSTTSTSPSMRWVTASTGSSGTRSVARQATSPPCRSSATRASPSRRSSGSSPRRTWPCGPTVATRASSSAGRQSAIRRSWPRTSPCSPHADYVAPQVFPSALAPGFLVDLPEADPIAIVRGIVPAVVAQTQDTPADVVPRLQAFDGTVPFLAPQVREEIEALGSLEGLRLGPGRPRRPLRRRPRRALGPVLTAETLATWWAEWVPCRKFRSGRPART